MANYTVELRTLLDSMGYDWGMNEYPVPKYAASDPQAFRSDLNEKIKSHYYFSEICDTPDRFKYFINSWMNVNMPYYCDLLQAFYDNDSIVNNANYLEKYIVNDESTNTISEAGNSNTASNSSGSSSGNNYNLTVNSTTPAGMLNVENDIENNTYASAAQKNKGNNSSQNSFENSSESSSKNNTDSSGTNKRNYVREITGTQGKTRAEQYKLYVESLQNIYSEIIDRLSIFFMEVY